MEMTQELVEDYLKLPHTLVLLIMPSTTRIHGCLPLELITNHTKTDQTVGVITKADIAPNDCFVDRFQELKRKLDGQSEDYVPLEHGYVAVCNPDTVSNDSLEKAACAEQSWFEKNLPGYIAKKSIKPSSCGETGQNDVPMFRKHGLPKQKSRWRSV